MRRPFGVFSGADAWTTIPTQAERDACKTCIDSFLAPDPDTLASVLTKVINQGASSGEFSAQQSLTDSIYELAGDAAGNRARPGPVQPAQPLRPPGAAPVRVNLHAAALHGADQGVHAGRPEHALDPRCDVRAVRRQSAGRTGPGGRPGTACRRWSANDKLVSRLATGMAAACPADLTALTTGSQCTFGMLWNGADVTNVATRTGVGIRRASSPRPRTASSVRPSTS